MKYQTPKITIRESALKAVLGSKTEPPLTDNNDHAKTAGAYEADE